jgi:hypothetical protein
MEIVKPTKYDKDTMKTKTEVPAQKVGTECSYPFQWLLFKPQAHAIPVFETQQQTRLDNTSWNNTPTPRRQ